MDQWVFRVGCFFLFSENLVFGVGVGFVVFFFIHLLIHSESLWFLKKKSLAVSRRCVFYSEVKKRTMAIFWTMDKDPVVNWFDQINQLGEA